MPPESNSYRERIYDRYVSRQDQPLAPATIDGLRPRLPLFRRIVKKYFPVDRNAVILDLGCGHGAFLYAMQEAGYKKARGVDISPEQVSAARTLGITSVEQGDVINVLIATAAGSVDVVVTFDLIEHFQKRELMLLTDQIHRVLKENGLWIIHVPNGESPFCSRVRYGDFTHELAFTRASLGQLLVASGFIAVSSHEDQPIPHGLKSALRFVLWRMIRFGIQVYIAIETGSFDRNAVLTQNFVAVARRSSPRT